MIVKWTGPLVRALREALHLSQDDFARALGASQRSVSNWERPDGRPGPAGQLALDRLFGTLVSTERARFEVLAEGDPSVNRRQFLAVATVATAATASGGSSVSPKAIARLRSTLHSHQMLDDAVGSNVTKPLVDTMADTCVGLLRGCPELLRPEMSGLAAEAVGSSAWAAWDQREFGVADALFGQAFEHAENAGDPDMQAGLLLHRSDLAIETRRYPAAADYADKAFDVHVRDPRLADYRSLRAAQAYAHVNRRGEARALLRKVSGDFTHQSTPNDNYVYWMSSWVTTYVTSAVLEASGDRRGAAEEIEESLRYVGEGFERHEGYSQLRLAQLYAPRDIDRAAEALKRAFELSRINTSPRLLTRFDDTRALLEPWAKTRAILELDDFTERPTVKTAGLHS